MNRLSKQEQETIILFNEQEQRAEVYTHNKALQRKISDLCVKYPEQFKLKSDNKAGGLTFLIPKKRITITTPRSMTPEQKEKARQNLLK